MKEETIYLGIPISGARGTLAVLTKRALDATVTAPANILLRELRNGARKTTGSLAVQRFVVARYVHLAQARGLLVPPETWADAAAAVRAILVTLVPDNPYVRDSRYWPHALRRPRHHRTRRDRHRQLRPQRPPIPRTGQRLHRDTCQMTC